MVNVELTKVDNWLRSNKLSLNYSKSTYMLTKSLKNNNNLSETCSFQIKIKLMAAAFNEQHVQNTWGF